MNTQKVNLVTECFITPKFNPNDRKQPYYLAPADLAMLSVNYIQKGLLFNKPFSQAHKFDVKTLLEKLKDSLSLTLVYFYPLAGQLTSEINEVQHSSLIFVDCDKGPGARFIHATLDMTVSDIVLPTDVPAVVQYLFDHHKAVNYDGHSGPLLSVQVTELTDGVFIGCSMNHVVADGTSYWQFWNVWSQIHAQQEQQSILVSNPPVHQRWFPAGSGEKISLPFIHNQEFIDRYEAPQLRERIFHFSSESISRVKSKANVELGKSDMNISSLQALSALVWRCITRARGLVCDQKTSCIMHANVRQRLDPPLPKEYFGNAIWVVKAAATADELLEHNLGSAAVRLYQGVSELTDRTVLDVFEAWMKSPLVYQIATFFDPNSVAIGSSPRFDVYGNDFGLGKPVAARSGYAQKFPGNVTVYPGRNGGGSMDLEICLPPDAMSALETDEEFMDVVARNQD